MEQIRTIQASTRSGKALWVTNTGFPSVPHLQTRMLPRGGASTRIVSLPRPAERALYCQPVFVAILPRELNKACHTIAKPRLEVVFDFIECR